MARDNSGFASQGRDPNWSPDGFGNETPGNGQFYGDNAYDTDVARDRQLGKSAQDWAPTTIDQRRGNESRGMQLSALQMLRAQANGTAPSSAAILSQRANQDAVRSAALQTTGAKSAGGAIAANRGAGEAAGHTMLAGNAANANVRAGEVGHGLGAYAGGAGQVQGQDIGVATADAQLAAQQRALNEQRQQFFERQGFNTRGVQHQAQQEAERQLLAKAQADRAYKAARSAADWGKVKDTVNMALTLGQSGLGSQGDEAPPKEDTTSDERAKRNVMPMGSLASLRRY
jgi:hypothetical protein